MATDTHMILEANGTVRRSQHTVSSIKEERSPEKRGKWTGDATQLVLDFGKGKTETYVYELSGDTLFFPAENHFRLWERVR